MGDGWRMDFTQTHFDVYSPPDFYTRVRNFKSLYESYRACLVDGGSEEVRK